MRSFICLLLLAVGLAACGPTMIVLREPTTGQIAECSRGPLPQVTNVMGENEACAQSYRERGFQQQTP